MRFVLIDRILSVQRGESLVAVRPFAPRNI